MLLQTYIELEPLGSESQKTVQTILLPKGHLIEVIIRLLTGNGDKTHLVIRENGYLFYADSPENRLSTKRLIDIDAKVYGLNYNLNPITMEVGNEDKERKSILKVDFVVSPSLDNRIYNMLQMGGK